MRKLVGILVCLFMVWQLHAVTYQTYKPCGGTSFRSTSVYVAESQYTGFTNNQSPITNHQSPITNHQFTGYGVNTLSAISASNFESLNSEGGACYSPANSSATIRRVRPGDAIGEYDFHSPVGDTPWIIIALFGILYLIRSKKTQKSEEKFGSLVKKHYLCTRFPKLR